MEKTDLLKAFEAQFAVSARAWAAAPGRLEILGNHTDYNAGLVLSCAVAQRTQLALAPNGSRRCRVKDLRDGSGGEFDLDKLDAPARPRWLGYLMGVVSELRKRGVSVGGFDALLFSTVPLSAGMSSSAALETATGFALREAFGIRLDPAEWARVGQGVENNFLGLKTGLLDQFSSIFGAADRMLVSDFESVAVVRTVPLAPEYRFLVVNSMVKHNLVDSEYNARREACESAAAKLGVKMLRAIAPEVLTARRAELTDLEYRRARHVVDENERVLAATAALDRGEVRQFGALLWESHESSRLNFENSTPELDYLVELSHELPGCLGARLSGGGFGGITIHLVAATAADEYAAAIRRRYAERYAVEPETILSALGAGAESAPVR